MCTFLYFEHWQCAVWIVWVLRSVLLHFSGRCGQINAFLNEKLCFCFLPALYGFTGALLWICTDPFSILYCTWNKSSWVNSTLSHTECFFSYCLSCWYTYIIVINANWKNVGFIWLCKYREKNVLDTDALMCYYLATVHISGSCYKTVINKLDTFPPTVRTFWSI